MQRRYRQPTKRAPAKVATSTTTSERLRAGLRHELRFPDGSDVGIFETNRTDWSVGDEFMGDGNRLYRIMDMIPLPLIEEFVDEPFYEAWEVEPVDIFRDAFAVGVDGQRPMTTSLSTRRGTGGSGDSELGEPEIIPGNVESLRF